MARTRSGAARTAVATARTAIDAAVQMWTAALGQQLEQDRLPPADHRPWPPPAGPWVMTQTWRDLAFLHWPVDRAALQALLPPTLEPDTIDGAAWLGIAPFAVSGLRVRGLPAVPGVSSFRELNVRTYVTVEGKPGVFFFSLDASSLAAVWGARLWYALPYFAATGGMRRRRGWIEFRSRRESSQGQPAALTVAYRPAGDPVPATPGTLEWWLAERYCLYAVDSEDVVYRAEIHHAPWPLQPADVTIQRNTMTAELGLTLSAQPVLAHFARRLDVTVWGPERVTAVSPA